MTCCTRGALGEAATADNGNLQAGNSEEMIGGHVL